MLMILYAWYKYFDVISIMNQDLGEVSSFQRADLTLTILLGESDCYHSVECAGRKSKRSGPISFANSNRR